MNDIEAVVATTKQQMNDIDLLRSILFQEHNGVLQIRHDSRDREDPHGEDSYFIRVAGDENSLFKPHSVLSIIGSFSIDIAPGINVYKERDNIKTIFGRNLAFALSKYTNQKSPRSIEAGYIPKTLSSNMDELPTQIEGSEYEAKQQLTWDIDYQNTGGIYIMAQYSPHLNTGTVARENPKTCTDYIHLKDDRGYYMFSRNDFPCIPDNSTVTLTAIRGAAISLNKNDDSSDVILAYSTNSRLFSTSGS